MTSTTLHPDRYHKIRRLFDEYIELYSSRDDRLTTLFSEDFSGYTVGGSVLVKNRSEWINIIRQDFSEVQGRIHIEIKDISIQELSNNAVVVTAFFHIHLPIPEHFFSREVARHVLIFRLENRVWKIIHSGISVPYHLAKNGEIYPLEKLEERNRLLEAMVEERTRTINEREEFYRLLTEDTLDVLWRTDSELRITYISPSDERLRGYKSKEVIGHHVFELFNDEGVAIVTEALRRRQKSEEENNPLGFVNFEAPHRCKDGSVIWGEVFSKAVRDEHGKIIGYHGITRENTKQKQMKDMVQQLAFYDTLTQLPNRRLLIDRLNQALLDSKRTGHHGALMFIDLDNFKPLNDNYGHFAGDILLIEAANRLESCVRETDSVARFGGDEFVVLLGELAVDYARSIAHAKTVAEKIRARLFDAYQLNVTHENRSGSLVEYRCSASIGIFVFQGHQSSAEDIMKCADKAMYQAKEEGRNTVRLYEKEGQAQ
ncbi:MAG: diguanylate cyclase domain-containing protein [Halomonas sp.]